MSHTRILVFIHGSEYELQILLTNSKVSADLRLSFVKIYLASR